MQIENINVHSLQNASYLSIIKCADFSEAAAVCLSFHNHQFGKLLSIKGDFDREFNLFWEEVTQQMKDTRNDMGYTVESGAYCLAMLVVEKLTNLKVTKQSQKRTGFDYWLGESQNIGFQDLARLEVSGILNGNIGQINRRLKEKIEQTKKSDKLNLPAYVAVVEFGRPLVKIKIR